MKITLLAVLIILSILAIILIFRNVLLGLSVAYIMCLIMMCFILWNTFNLDSSREKVQIIYVNKDNDSIPEKEYWIEKLKEADNPDSILFYKQKILLEEFNSKQ